MKKIVFYIICIVIIICVLITYKLLSKKEQFVEIKQFNTKYERYLNKEIIGTDVASVINQAVDDNEFEMIKKDKDGKYISNDETSINIEIMITEFTNDQLLTMETLYGGGIEKFVEYYGQIHFKSIKVEYNKNNRIKYILFEQI